MAEEQRLTDGVSVDAVRAFLSDLKRECPNSYADMTTEDACQQLVVPRTKEHNCAYVDLLRRDSSQDVNKATVFVSHAWRYKITDVLNTLLEFAEEQEKQGDDGKPVFFWFDLFMNNQNVNVTANLPQDWWSTTFKQSIANIGRVLLVLMPWHDPVPLTRAWCLWEIFCGISNEGTEVSIRLPQHEEKALEKAIRDKYDAVTDMLVRVQAQRAEARNENDKAMIFKAIETWAGGFGAVNQAVKDQLRAWCLSRAITVVGAMERRGEDGTDTFAQLCGHVGVVLVQFGETDRAIAYYERALTIYLETEVGTSVDVAVLYMNVAALYCNLGNAYDDNGEYDKAIEYHEKAHEIRMALGRPDTADTYHNLGLAYENKGEYDKAIECHQKAREICVEMMGEKHPSTAEAYSSLGNVYNSKGEYDRAIGYFENAREIKVEALGERHPSTANTYHNLGIAYRSKGKYDRAIECFEKAREIYVETLGKKHPSTANTYNNLGSAYVFRGAHEKAIAYLEKAHEIHAETLGEKHPGTANSCNNLGIAYQEKGEHDKAIEYFEKAREIKVEALGEKHPSTANTYNNLGNAYSKVEYDKAIEYYEKAREIKVETLGEKHPSTANTCNNLGSAYDSRGEHDRAIEYYEKAREIYVETLGEKHPSTADTYTNLGITCANKGEYDKAIEYHEKAREIRVETLGEKHPSSATTYNSLGDTFVKKGDHYEAIAYCEQALAIQLEHLGDQHASTAITFCTMGEALEGNGDMEDAARYFQLSLSVLVSERGPDDPNTQDAQAGLDRVQQSMGVAQDCEKGESACQQRHQDNNPKTTPPLKAEKPNKRSKAHLSGWLQKLKRNGRAFLPRWFSITADDQLVCSKTKIGRVRRSIPLSTVQTVELNAHTRELHVTTPKRTFVLRLDSRSDATLKDWCAALRTRIAASAE